MYKVVINNLVEKEVVGYRLDFYVKGRKKASFDMPNNDLLVKKFKSILDKNLVKSGTSIKGIIKDDHFVTSNNDTVPEINSEKQLFNFLHKNNLYVVDESRYINEGFLVEKILGRKEDLKDFIEEQLDKQGVFYIIEGDNLLIEEIWGIGVDCFNQLDCYGLDCKGLRKGFTIVGRYFEKMSPKLFWGVIDTMVKKCGDDQEKCLEWLNKKFSKMPKENVMLFYGYLEVYHSLAKKYGLWSVASIVRERGCSDDAFDYFLYWLVSQGSRVYKAVLSNPDNLYKVSSDYNYSFEELGYAVEEYLENCRLELSYSEFESAKKEAEGYIFQSNKLEVSPYIKYPVDRYYAHAFYPNICKKYNISREDKSSSWNLSGEDKKLYEEGKKLAFEKLGMN